MRNRPRECYACARLFVGDTQLCETCSADYEKKKKEARERLNNTTE